MTPRQSEVIRDLVRVVRQPGATTAKRIAGRMRALGYTNEEILQAVNSVEADRRAAGGHKAKGKH
jgi:hypothetical protein